MRSAASLLVYLYLVIIMLGISGPAVSAKYKRVSAQCTDITVSLKFNETVIYVCEYAV